MELGMINSFLVVCFTMVQKKKCSNWKIFAKFVQKYHGMAIKHLGKNALLLQSMQEKIYQIFSCNFAQLSIYDIKVDQVPADYSG